MSVPGSQAAARAAAPADLDECAREPIHIPGAIQPNGVLLALDDTGVVRHVSANAGQLFEQTTDQLIGQPLGNLLALDEPPDDEGERPWHSRWLAARFPSRADTPDRTWHAALHRYVDHAVIELEPQTRHFDEDPVRSGYEHARQLERDHSLEEAAGRTARLLRELLGFDRVMVYRFDTDWHGEVIAEAVRKPLEPYLGLHYPATDIPAQARALYLRNRVRTIGDVNYTPVPILPASGPDSAAPLDLSDVALRSVSPVHLEYLSNMGVGATLVASIIVNGRLWGLIACHHYAPLYADAPMRELADAVTSALASRIGALEELAKIEIEGTLLTVREKLITAFSEVQEVSAEQLMALAPSLLDVVDADGVAVFAGEVISSYGLQHDIDALRRIRLAVSAAEQQRDPITGVLHTDNLAENFPELADLASEAAGIIFMPLAQDAHNALLWTRREQVHSVRWGGNPHLSKLENIPGARLSPRQSFSAWQENVRGRSRRWSSVHLESARSLRVLIELMERKHHQRDVALLRASLERMPTGVLIVQAHSGYWRDSPLAFVNQRLGASIGRPASALHGEAVGSLLDDSDRNNEALAALDRALQQHEQATVTLTLRQGEPTEPALQLEITPIRNEHERITHWLAVQQPG